MTDVTEMGMAATIKRRLSDRCSNLTTCYGIENPIQKTTDFVSNSTTDLFYPVAPIMATK